MEVGPPPRTFQKPPSSFRTFRSAQRRSSLFSLGPTSPPKQRPSCQGKGGVHGDHDEIVKENEHLKENEEAISIEADRFLGGSPTNQHMAWGVVNNFHVFFCQY